MSVSTNPYQAPTSDVARKASSTYTPKIFEINGRIGRLRYLAYSMITMLFFIVVAALGATAFEAESSGENESISILLLVLYIPVIFYSLVLSRRRLNDMDRSGWFSILYFVPLANMIFTLWLVFGRGSETENRFGPAPTPNTLAIKFFGWFAVLVPFLGIMAAIAIPAYQDYVERSQSYISE